MSYIDMIGHLSFLIAALSLLMRDIILLRILSIVSSIVGIAFNFMVVDEPLWVPIIWLSLFMAINVFMIISFYLSRRVSGLSPEDLEIWKTNFLGLTTEEFRRVRKLFSFRTYQPGDLLTRDGEDNAALYFVTSGNLDVRRGGHTIGTLAKGDIVGEMSFLSEAPANADVVADDQTECILVEKAKLRAAMMKHPSFHISMTNLFSQNLIKKLAA